MLPMNIACQGSTVAQPAVMETRPARMPLLSAPGGTGLVVRVGGTWLVVTL